MAATIPNGRCDPQNEGCKALSDAKNAIFQERGKHLTPIYEELKKKAGVSEMEELSNRIWAVIILQVAMLGSLAASAIMLYLKR